jgi:DNA-binding beta-propeller fold protein YncE
MKKQRLSRFVFSAVVILLGLSAGLINGALAAPGSTSGKFPTFEPDPVFPKLPNGWVLGNVAKVVVDRHDNVWIIHRPRTVPAGKMPAPPVLEFDAAGKFLQAWGGDGPGYDWPDAEHNVFVDYKDNVWISGSSPGGQSKTQRSDDMLLKFSNTGKFLMEIGGRSVSLGSKDPKSVNKPGDIFVSAKTNEVYVADGYGNRRVVVFDADTGAFKRMWGAFGKPPEDDASSGGRGSSGGPLGATGGRAGGSAPPPALDTEGPGSPRFASPVHGIVVSNDNIVYVADRSNRRVQMFTPKGKYLGQFFVNRAGPSPDSACGFALSPDKKQQFLYIADFGNSHLVVFDRKKLEVLYQFGKRGAEPGNFQGIHHIAVDSKGNLYAGEVAPGARVQRFVYKGLSPTLPSNAVHADQLSANH